MYSNRYAWLDFLGIKLMALNISYSCGLLKRVTESTLLVNLDTSYAHSCSYKLIKIVQQLHTLKHNSIAACILIVAKGIVPTTVKSLVTLNLNNVKL